MIALLRLGVAFACAFVALPIAAFAADLTHGLWTCRPGSMQVCQGGECTAAQPTIWIEVDCDKGIYRRCDEKGCDAYSVACTRSGAFITINPSSGSLFKSGPNTPDFVEIVTQWTTAYIYHGTCDLR